MASKWTMTKTLGVREMNGTLHLKEEELKVRKNLLEWWPQSKLKKVITDIGNGVKITLFDVNRNETLKTTMRRVALEEYDIEWNIEGKGYVLGDEILMCWDPKNEQLCYQILAVSALRNNPQIADTLASSSSSFNR